MACKSSCCSPGVPDDDDKVILAPATCADGDRSNTNELQANNDDHCTEQGGCCSDDGDRSNINELQANNDDSCAEQDGCCSDDGCPDVKAQDDDTSCCSSIPSNCGSGCCDDDEPVEKQSELSSGAKSDNSKCGKKCCSGTKKPKTNEATRSKPKCCGQTTSTVKPNPGCGKRRSCCLPKASSAGKNESSCLRGTSCCPPPCPTTNSCCVDDRPVAANPTTLETCSKKCCSTPHAPNKPAEKITSSCHDDPCCTKEASTVVQTSQEPSLSLPANVTQTNLVADPEKKGLSGNEHIILSISGMTCTGCETKLRRVLATLPYVENLKTSLVLARVEFDLVLAAGFTAEDVMKYLERTTEFKCERVSTQGSSIDLVVSGPGCTSAADLVDKQEWPSGVTDMAAIDDQTVRVFFDPEVVGARDLVERGDWKATSVHLAPPRLDPSLEAGSKHVRHVGYMTLLSAFLTVPVLILAWAPLPKHEIAYGSASLALATVVQVAVAGQFYPRALKSLVFSRVIEMDLLIVLSTSAAYIFSVISFGYLAAGKPLSTGEFFETSTLLVTLIMVGRYASALARQKAVESISIRSLQTPTAVLVGSDGNGSEEREIDARLLQHRDIFKVAPDSRIPTDGTVISGSSEVDESMLTGESIPVEKYAGSSVIAGSINGPGTLVVRLTRVPGNNTISTIAGMVDEARLSKPRIQALADRVASYFVPVVVALALCTLVIWIAVGVAVRKQSGSEAAVQALTYAITVLIVSCPCAIGLAVPMVVVIASGVAAERGVIFKSGDSIEVAHRASHVVFDKTGTLTEGRPRVVTEEYYHYPGLGSDGDGDIELAKSQLLGLIGDIKHPVSAAIAAHLRAAGVSASAVSDVKTLTGKGVEGNATASGCFLRAGNSRWLQLSEDPRVQAVLARGHTAFCFVISTAIVAAADADNSTRLPVAVFGLEDALRPDAVSTVEKLQKAGIAVHMVSGDDDGAVRAVASRLGVPEANVRSRATPADKQAHIQALLNLNTYPPASPTSRNNGPLQTFLNSKQKKQEQKQQQPVVIFCGDGTNDAVALAQATIGVHMSGSNNNTTATKSNKNNNDKNEPDWNTGTDAARSAADVVLLRPSPAGVLTILAVSRAAARRIMLNFAWSAVYNLAAVLLAAGAFVGVHGVGGNADSSGSGSGIGGGGVRIPPALAGLGELVSVLPVIVAAVMLRWARVEF